MEHFSTWVFALTLLSGFNAQAKEVINWFVADMPPFISTNTAHEIIDIQAASGPIADLHRQIEKSLPEYEHRYHLQSIPRGEVSLKKKNHYCTLILLQSPQREEFAYFGASFTKTPYKMGLITLKKYIDAKNTDLEAYLDKKDFTLAVLSKRFYGNDVAPILKKYSARTISLVRDEENMAAVFKLLEKNRVQGTLGYKFEIEDYLTKNPAADMGFQPVKQMNEGHFGRVSCEKTPWGKVALDKVSNVIKAIK
ncbi:TIGR02285 family protein [Bdellovibrio sp. NC01]|uniref:TIGR02285 family protein n=1 Tax=Bdellovibrio sp. NC01 TaxID=2220073 RepID=UPI00115BD81E|nr:TIGR02285 family protein [Bdellovibrio sp. NC01]QDK37633.1 hypothetical protein DOE51_08590 [Bdellovibrio sp. NC01]